LSGGKGKSMTKPQRKTPQTQRRGSSSSGRNREEEARLSRLRGAAGWKEGKKVKSRNKQVRRSLVSET